MANELVARGGVLACCMAMLAVASGCAGHRKRDAALAATTLFAAAVVAETIASTEGASSCEPLEVDADAWCGCEYGRCACD